MELKSSQLKLAPSLQKIPSDYNIRECPECGLETIKNMPGGRDSTCNNCGYKDPCCYD